MSLRASQVIGVFALALLMLGTVVPANAARVPALSKDAAIIVDGVSGRILYERDGYEIRYPASLTKMMTLYLMFESFENGSLSFNSQLPTSSFAASQSPTKLNLRPGETIDAKTAMEAIIVRSANDVAVVVAEAIGGTEPNFALMMTQKAGELGMLNTHFANASGLPHAQQISTAYDMALLGRRLAYDFPEFYKFLDLDEFSFKGRRYTGHNNLLGVFEGTDGIKTGYTRASGFNLVTSVVRGNKHILGVVMGGPTAATRDEEMKRILALAFEEVENNPLLIAYANVPWGDGEGPKIFPSFDAAVPPPVLLAAFGPQIQSPRSAQAAQAIAIAALPSESAVIPREKPAAPVVNSAAQTYASGDMIASLIQGLTSINNQGSGREQVAFAQTNQLSAMLPSPKPRTFVVLPSPKPGILKASLPGQAQQGDVAENSSELRSWSVQIGAFTTESTANAQLEIYAQHSVDVLGRAERLVVPFSGEG
ncbi:MAG: D-alanyl-D-alanine carboxypeptidase family protein, partial [Alphaproteobacteria bacterium]